MQGLHWVWDMLKLVVAPAVAPGVDLPHVTFYNDFGYLDRKEWLCIQTSVLLNERHVLAKLGPARCLCSMLHAQVPVFIAPVE